MFRIHLVFAVAPTIAEVSHEIPTDLEREEETGLPGVSGTSRYWSLHSVRRGREGGREGVSGKGEEGRGGEEGREAEKERERVHVVKQHNLIKEDKQQVGLEPVYNAYLTAPNGLGE